MALIIPAAVRSKKLTHLNFLNSFLIVTQTSFPPLTGTFYLLYFITKIRGIQLFSSCLNAAAFPPDVIRSFPTNIILRL